MTSEPSVIPTYKIIRIPRESPRLRSFIAKFRDIRIAAIKADPKSFLTQHDTEAAFPLPIWEARFRVCAAALICVAILDPTLSDEETLIQGEWAGFAAVRGPMNYTTYYASPDLEQPIPEDTSIETRWHVFDMYTQPAHRQRGLAKKLLNGCVDAAVEFSLETRSRHTRKARVRIFMDPRNPLLQHFYRTMGFVESGKPCLVDGLTANGMTESIPVGGDMTDEVRAHWEDRFGLAMEKLVELK
jgi:GNAT superfamily N-acetyltransferase